MYQNKKKEGRHIQYRRYICRDSISIGKQNFVFNLYINKDINYNLITRKVNYSLHPSIVKDLSNSIKNPKINVDLIEDLIYNTANFYCKQYELQQVNGQPMVTSIYDLSDSCKRAIGHELILSHQGKDQKVLQEIIQSRKQTSDSISEVFQHTPITFNKVLGMYVAFGSTYPIESANTTDYLDKLANSFDLLLGYNINNILIQGSVSFYPDNKIKKDLKGSIYKGLEVVHKEFNLGVGYIVKYAPRFRLGLLGGVKFFRLTEFPYETEDGEYADVASYTKAGLYGEVFMDLKLWRRTNTNIFYRENRNKDFFLRTSLELASYSIPKRQVRQYVNLKLAFGLNYIVKEYRSQNL